MKPIVILKFGGKLLETPDQIRGAANYIIRVKKSGKNPVVVVSAPGKSTDQFLALASQISDNPSHREMDMLLSVGERTAMALLAMAINHDNQYHAVSFTGSQIGIITDTQHTNARVLEVKCYRIREALEQDHIPIVAGFQGVSTEREITTLGRGGSDTTAVSLAAALNAEICVLVKEHGGIYSGDPELIPDAVKLNSLDFETLESITAAGAKVVQSRAATLAKQHNIRISISGIGQETGTLVSDRTLSASLVAGIVLEEGVSVITLSGSLPEMHPDMKPSMLFYSGSSGYLITREKVESAVTVPEFTVISVIGWGGVLDSRVIVEIMNLLRSIKAEPYAMAAQHGHMNVLLERKHAITTARLMHTMCLENRFIHVNV